MGHAEQLLFSCVAVGLKVIVCHAVICQMLKVDPWDMLINFCFLSQKSLFVGENDNAVLANQGDYKTSRLQGQGDYKTTRFEKLKDYKVGETTKLQRQGDYKT